MPNREESMPAWMACDEIISKAREELLSRAILVMHEQVEKKRISMEGRPLTLNESDSEREKDMFLLLQLVKERESIEKQFASYVEDASVSREALARAGELEKFLLSLKQMALFYDYSKECESWLAEVEKELKEKDPKSILVKTAAMGSRLRKEILEFLITDRTLAKEELFSKEERVTIKEALGSLANQ